LDWEPYRCGGDIGIARRIGATTVTAQITVQYIHSFLALILSVIVTLPLVIFAEQIALLFGAGETTGLL